MASSGYNISKLAHVLADDTKTLEKYYINIDDKVIKNTFDEGFLPFPETEVVCSPPGPIENVKS